MEHAPRSAPRFLVDAMLGHVAHDLRLLGLDARYAGDLEDAAILGLAQREGRCLLTRDEALARRAGSLPHLFVRRPDREAQVQEVLQYLPRDLVVDPLSRCLPCNGVVIPVPREDAAGLVPDHLACTEAGFRRCTGCARVYWAGSHAPRLARRVEELLGILRSPRNAGA